MKKEEKKPWPQKIAVFERGMIETQHYEATKAGIEILAGGGNAIDAAVESVFALGVCEHNARGLGHPPRQIPHPHIHFTKKLVIYQNNPLDENIEFNI